MFNIIPYLQIPYVWGGRSFDGADCFGLIKLVYEAELGINIPDYSSGIKDLKDASDKNIAIENVDEFFVSVHRDDVRQYDIVLFLDNSPVPNHIGIMIDDKNFLHLMENPNCTVGKLSRWRQKIYGFYRHKELVDED